MSLQPTTNDVWNATKRSPVLRTSGTRPVTAGQGKTLRDAVLLQMTVDMIAIINYAVCASPFCRPEQLRVPHAAVN
jgi:hypothetical protein